MKKINNCLLAILWPLLNCFAQSPPPIRPLSVGDKLPDITFSNVYNYPVSKLQLSSFKGKLIILDFWSTWCNSCIAKLDAIDSLQKQFDGQLKIIMVNNIAGTGDTKSKISSFFKKWKDKRGTPFYTTHVVEDTIACKFFPHTFLPHYVWIGKNGKVAAITSSEELTKENILLLLAGCKLKATIKKE